MEKSNSSLQSDVRRSGGGVSWLELLLIPVIFLLGLGVGYLIWGMKASTSINSPVTADAAPTQRAVQRYDVPDDGDPSLGPADAPVTIIEFSDFECPYCRKWQVEVWPQIQAAYGNKVRLVYRDFPLYGLHANAASSAEAANCAGAQNKYWEFHDKLFSADASYSVELYQQFAAELSLNLDEFNTCLTAGTYADEVQADYDWAVNLGIQSTPTFFINGIPLIGAQPFASFQAVIDQELAGAGQ